MANLNKVHLIGNLCRDPEVRYTPGGTAVGDLGLAVNSRVKSGTEWKDEVTFIDVTCWAQSAEYAQKYLAKGASVFVEGRLQLDTWEDKQSGQKRSKLKVVAESVQGLGQKSGGNQGEPRNGGSYEPSQPRTPAHSSSQSRDNGGEDYEDESDSIPF